jgi:hypothetical protein
MYEIWDFHGGDYDPPFCSEWTRVVWYMRTNIL